MLRRPPAVSCIMLLYCKYLQLILWMALHGFAWPCILKYFEMPCILKCTLHFKCLVPASARGWHREGGSMLLHPYLRINKRMGKRDRERSSEQDSESERERKERQTERDSLWGHQSKLMWCTMLCRCLLSPSLSLFSAQYSNSFDILTPRSRLALEQALFGNYTNISSKEHLRGLQAPCAPEG